ncbi:barstar family protein [Thermomonas sp.]|uniref:barstar family protein n=1 Tax=Thermomonas sp. TaxID=1971895 RepID=UPI002489FDA8|nr:barstar family protein [Thermomonas sp.]MDI1253596.1 barstar family protein [Thermomonas sp.]
MSESGFDLGLDDPGQAGVYFATNEDLRTIGMAARDAGLLARSIDLRGCKTKATLLLRMSSALDTPTGSGRNWDALSDQLRDMAWLPAAGYALLFDDASDLRNADEASFDTLLDILQEAATDWAQREVPFWAFLALAEDEFEQPQ